MYVELAAAGEAALNITLRWTNKTTTRRASLALAPLPLIFSYKFEKSLVEQAAGIALDGVAARRCHGRD